MVDQIRAVLFLSTPHRGTDLAETLNRILSVSIFNHAPKQYINELKQNSPLIQDINEDFRNYSPKLQIFSFYETLKTAMGPKNLVGNPFRPSNLFPAHVLSDGSSKRLCNTWLSGRSQPTPQCRSPSRLQVQ